MTPRVLLLTGAGVLAAAHVVGVLLARPLFRPAEVLAALCLLACAVRYDLLADRHPAAWWARWGLTGAAAVLVAWAAVTVPPPPGQGAELRFVFLSPEEYSELARRAQLDTLTPVAVTLLFVLMLLAAMRRESAAPAAGSRRSSVPSRVILGTAIGAAVLIAGYAVLRVAVITFSTTRRSTSSADQNVSVWGLPAVAAVLLPLLLALASLALGAVTAARGNWGAASGGVLLVAAALIFLDSAIGSVSMPYAAHDYAALFSLDLIEPTAALPQPTRAMTAALRLAAAVLVVTSLTRHQAGAMRLPRTDPAG